MRVSVIINPRAGTVNPMMIREKVSAALFRCDLHFHISESSLSMEQFILDETLNSTNVFVVCGGDGTINSTLQTLLRVNKKVEDLPAFCLIRSGTANDLAHQMGISQKIDQAARQILEGKVKKIDVIEVISGEEKKFMLTNGGIGIPAMAADRANQLRSMLQQLAKDGKKSWWVNVASDLSYKFVKKMGAGIYSTMLVEAIQRWKHDQWSLEIEFANGTRLSTKAAFILVNNQPTLGKKYVTAPYTANDDGQVNLLLVDADTKLSQLEAFIKVARGTLVENEHVKSFETSQFTIHATNPNVRFSFFGDGEILFRDVQTVTVNCLKRYLSLVVHE